MEKQFVGILSNRATVHVDACTPEILAQYTYKIRNMEPPRCGNCIFFEPTPTAPGCWGKPRNDLPLTQAGLPPVANAFSPSCSEFQLADEHTDAFSYTYQGDRVHIDCGDTEKLFRLFPHVKWVDIRSMKRHGYPLTFQWDLREYQKGGTADILRRSLLGFGSIMQAPTGAGKTVMMSWLTSALRYNTLILVDEGSLAEQWEKEIRDSTNIDQIEAETGETILGVYGRSKKKKDKHRLFPITIAMYQSLSASKEYFESNEELRNYFGVTISDECHGNAAPTFSAVTRYFAPKVRVGVSATPTRPDLKHQLTHDLIGPVKVKVPVRQSCYVYAMQTGFNVPNSINRYQEMQQMVASSADRNDLILSWLKYDVDNGRRPLVFTLLTDHADYLSNRFEQMYSAEGRRFRSYSVTGKIKKSEDRRALYSHLKLGGSVSLDDDSMDCPYCAGTGAVAPKNCISCTSYTNCTEMMVRRLDISTRKVLGVRGPIVTPNLKKCRKHTPVPRGPLGRGVCQMCDGLGIRPTGADALFLTKIGIKGLNIPIVDCVYLAMPQASVENTGQMVGRGLRFLVGKPNSIVRDFLDKGWGGIYGSYKKRSSYYLLDDPGLDKVPYPIRNIPADFEMSRFVYP